MLYANRKSKAGLVLWGDIYELKALWNFILRVMEESDLLEVEDPLLSGLAYEVRHAFDGMRQKSNRDWFGDDTTPIYGLDCLWPIMLVQMGLLRAGLAFMPNVTRADQAAMYGLESTVLAGLEAMQPGLSEKLYQSVLSACQLGDESIHDKAYSRTSYFLTLTPAKRKADLAAILDTLGTHYAIDNPLVPDVFEPFRGCSEYPDFKW